VPCAGGLHVRVSSMSVNVFFGCSTDKTLQNYLSKKFQ